MPSLRPPVRAHRRELAWRLRDEPRGGAKPGMSFREIGNFNRID
jgi:hypothetical protein